MSNSLFKTSSGARLAADVFDFHKHIDGGQFHHQADDIDITDPSQVYGNATNVEDALNNINDYINGQASAGQGFVTIGDGYDVWHAANGSVNFDPSIPTLNSLLNPLFTRIYNGQSVPAQFQRIAGSGIIVIKAGTYVIDATISVPPGIILIGEGYGTKIVNITSLNIPAAGIAPTPKVSPTPAPLFKILPDLTRAIQDSPVDASLFMFSRPTKIMNMLISDNFVEPTIAGENYYKLAQNKTGSNPLISQQAGSSLELHNVYMMGRVVFSAGTAVSQATRFAIQLDTSTSITNGTYLKLNTCFIDGFSQPIQYHSGGGINDYVEIHNSKIRSHGYLDADSSSASKNCIISANDNNTLIANNSLFGNHSNCKTVLFLNSQLGSPPVLQNKSKILITDNDLVINRGSNGAITATPLSVNASISGTYTTRVVVFTFSNIHQTNLVLASNNTSLTLDDTSVTLISNGTTTITNAGNMTINTTGSNTLTSTTSTSISATTSISLSSTTTMGLTVGSNLTVNVTGTSTYTSPTTTFSGNFITFATGINYPSRLISGNYTIDSSGPDYYLFISSGIGAPITITLPLASANAGRTIIIKDQGISTTFNNTLARSASGVSGGEKIEGLASDYNIDLDYQTICLTSQGGHWWFTN